MTERLQVVDENDNPIGIATREEAWTKGLILRHSYIVLRDSDGNFLLQQRSLKKKSQPGKWTWAATGHVDEGETYETAAARELQEEIGVTTPLTFVGKLRSTHPSEHGVVNLFISVFTGIITHNTPLIVDPEEVQDTRWLTPTELSALMSDQGQVTYNTYLTYQKFFS